MDLNRLTRDADDLIRKVVSRYNQLYVPAGTISQLELDLMLDDLRKLYDTFKNIGHINLTLQDTIVKPEVRINTAVPVDPHPAAASTPSYYNKDHFNSPPAHEPAQEPPHPMQEAEPVTEKGLDYAAEQEYKSEPETGIILPADTEEEFVTESEFEPEPVHKKQEQAVPELDEPIKENIENGIPANPEPVPGMLADKFNTGNKSLSETIASAQNQAGMGSRMLFQPIADLNTGIGLNDKFSFISDLFGNNTTQYDEAITRINKAVNLDEANWILQKYHSAVWDQKHESLARLKDFVKRRFI
jgi:hypothetical protein